MRPSDIRELVHSKADKETAVKVYNCLKEEYIPKSRYNCARNALDRLKREYMLMKAHLTFEQSRLKREGYRVTNTDTFHKLRINTAKEPIALDKQE